MIWLLLAHAALAIVATVTAPKLRRHVLLLGAGAPALSAVYALVGLGGKGAGLPHTESWQWVPAIGLDLTFRLDGFAAFMALLIGAIGVLVFVYAWRYFEDSTEGLGRFTGSLIFFAGAMLGLVVADNLILLFIFWELTSIASYLLIGFKDRSAAARAAALQALLVTGTGGLAMLAGLVVLGQAANTYSLAAILANPPTGTPVSVGLALVLVGAFSKSAQVPFHFWLPGAMAAPTPVSAYLHSATMVKAGIYLVARLAPVFAPIVGWWRPVVVAVGMLTMLVGGWRALARHDLKLLLADGTVSQLGFIVALVGFGIPELTFAGVAMILAHAIFKSGLFMVTGVVQQQTGTRDYRRLSEVGARLPFTFLIALAATSSMIGLPPLLGFVTKEAALEGLVIVGAPFVAVGVVAGSVLTVAYGLRFMWGAFARKSPEAMRDDPAEIEGWPSRWFLLPPALLAAASIVAGLAPALVDGLVGEAAASLDPRATGEHLALWHGFGTPLTLSLTALLGGFVVWRYPLNRLRRLTARVPSTDTLYNSSLIWLNRTADRVTSILQNGSLPIYLGVILTAAAIGPGILMLTNFESVPESLVVSDSPLQIAAVAVIVLATLALVTVRRRLGAVLLLGAVGYGVAVIFVIQGAPDLALTQMLVEMLALALFVLVLYHLPERFDVVEWRLRNVTRGILAIGVGLLTSALAMWASTGDQSSLVAEFMSRAEPEAGGRNVVNVILTDFRALDTLGEITVLTVAAIGALMMLRANRQSDEHLEDGE